MAQWNRGRRNAGEVHICGINESRVYCVQCIVALLTLEPPRGLHAIQEGSRSSSSSSSSGSGSSSSSSSSSSLVWFAKDSTTILRAEKQYHSTND